MERNAEIRVTLKQKNIAQKFFLVYTFIIIIILVIMYYILKASKGPSTLLLALNTLIYLNIVDIISI